MLNSRASAFAACLALITCGGGGTPKADASASASVVSQSQSQQTSYFPPIPRPEEFDTVPEHSDFRRLMIGTCPGKCRPGPLAWIHPRIASSLWSSEQRDSGQVIARIISDSAYPKFNIHERRGGRDTVYWAVVKRGDAVVSIFRSTTPGAKDLESRTEVILHGRGFFRGVSLARWIWSDKDDMAWGTCDGGACCRSDGLGFH